MFNLFKKNRIKVAKIKIFYTLWDKNNNIDGCLSFQTEKEFNGFVPRVGDVIVSNKLYEFGQVVVDKVAWDLEKEELRIDIKSEYSCAEIKRRRTQ